MFLNPRILETHCQNSSAVWKLFEKPQEAMAAPVEISNPLGVIDELFARAASCATQQNKLPPNQWNEKAHFVQSLQLADEENFAKVPCLNDVDIAESIAPFTLVRYRCLVQDVFEPELYSMVFIERDGDASRFVTTKYRESYPSHGKVLEDVGRGGLSTRGAYYCVPLPGESAWSKSTVVNRCAKSQSPPVSTGKRCRDEDIDMESAPETTGAPETREIRESRSQKSKTFEVPEVVPRPAKNSDAFGLNFPLPWEVNQRNSCACIVKLYDEDAESLKLCESVEILGILCVDPAMANLGEEVQAWPLPDARSPSTALVPRLHGLLVRRLPFYHPLFPFTANWLSEARLASAYQRRLAAPGAVAAARSTAMRSLQEALGGDPVAAEYLLALMATRVYGHANGTALGQWSLNLSHWTEEVSVTKLFEVVSNLVPLAVHLELTVETLRSGRWKPKKDFDANRLVAGRLQLAPGSFLFLDESHMQPGELNDDGVRSLQALSTLVSDQMLQCDFNNYDVQIPLEVNCLFVSKGVSILKIADLVLPVRPEPLQSIQCDAALDAARFLLGLITRHTKPFRMPEQVERAFCEDFAQLRQECREIGQRTVHVWRSLARAICFTHGEEECSMERWRSIFALEKERLRRLAEAEALQG